MITITRHVEFDAGHRIPDHQSKCCHMHGHRYRVEATVSGQLHVAGPETGMVVDFSGLGKILQGIHDTFDHAFLVYQEDTSCIQALAMIDNHQRTVELSRVPTAENLAVIIAESIQQELPLGVCLRSVCVWETPKCRATWFRESEC